MNILRRLVADWYLFGFVSLLILVGIATIYSIVLPRDQLSLATNQAIYAVVGMILSLLLGTIDYRRLKGVSLAFYGMVTLLLILVLFFGESIFGARRWLSLPGFQLQPSELAKLAGIVLLARFLGFRHGTLSMKHLLLLLGFIALPILLVLRQPDLGTAIVLAGTAVIMLLVGRLDRRQWLLLTSLAGIAAVGIALNLKDYQIERIQTFLNPSADPYGAGYNVLQSLIAIGNGGLFGRGLGHGTQGQLEFLPVAHTDFVFAGIAEAFGLAGSVLIILVFAAVIGRVLLIARRANDDFGFMLGVGIAGAWMVQCFINIGMNLALLPVTGIPLPFVSHGGSSLVTNLLAFGIVQSIARHIQSAKN